MGAKGNGSHRQGRLPLLPIATTVPRREALLSEHTSTAGGFTARPSQLLTAQELATRLSVSAEHIYDLTARGRLPKVSNLGRTVRFYWPHVAQSLGIDS